MFALRPLRFLAAALSAQHSSRQLALGFALGMLVGLVPKGNLTAFLLLTILCSTRVNLAAGMLSAFLFSWVGLLTDPLTHRLGNSLLTAPTLQTFWTSLYSLPVVPWTAFNNTVVLGSLLLGIALWYPVYRFSEPAFAKIVPILQDRLRRYWVARALFAAEWAGRVEGS